MKGSFAVVFSVAACLVGVSWVGAQDPKASPKADEPKAATKPGSLFPAGYLDDKELTAALRKVAADHPRAVRLSSLANSREGRDVWLVALGRNVPNAPAKPSVLVVANLEADHVVGAQVALGLIEKLAAADGKDAAVSKLLDERTIYVVPRLNPDGAERFLKGSPKFDLRANLAAIDRDRDGKANEDGPNDLDGDGLALVMRVKDGKATLVPDAKDARILRKADPIKGEKAVYSEMSEGSDDDGDGLINEDPPGGVNLNRNWPQGWTEYTPETGVNPASEPEVNALIRFAFAHPEIGAIWSFGLNDNLRAAAKGVAAGDAPYFAELTAVFTKAAVPTKGDTPKAEPARKAEVAKEEPKAEAAPAVAKGQTKGQTKGQGGRGGFGGGAVAASAPAPPPVASGGIEGTTDGALSEWAYQQYGVIGLASRLWTGPETATGEGEARWLDWNDHQMAGAAFVGFHPVDHPTLGKVEVGGWKPGVRLNPPIEDVGKIVDGHLAFLKDLAGKLPGLAVKEAKAEARGGGVFEIKATIENPGYLPTALAQGLTTRKAPPVLVKLGLGDAKLLSGRALDRIDSLPGSGGTREFRWLVLAPAGTKSLTLDASCAKAGSARREITLP